MNLLPCIFLCAALAALTSQSSPARTVNYGFDPVGNRTNVTDNGSGTSYTANNLNQYTAVGGASPTYDANGNLTNYNGWAYAYDAQNRLWGAANSNTTGLFTYDARNRVVSRVVNSTTNYYFYDDWNLVSDRDAAGNALQTYVHGPRIDELIFKTDGSNVVYYHHDALGNVTHLSDSYSRVVERYRYDIYGKATIKDGAGTLLTGTAYGNRFQFTGREYLADFGLHDYRNRVYLQSWGRFIQTDPVRFDATDVNIYRYCANSVISRTDPSGMTDSISVGSSMGIMAGIGGAFGAAGGALNAYLDGGSFGDAFVGACAGGAIGAITGALAAWNPASLSGWGAYAQGMGLSGIGGAGSQLAWQAYYKPEIDWDRVGISGAFGLAAGAMGTWLSGLPEGLKREAAEALAGVISGAGALEWDTLYDVLVNGTVDWKKPVGKEWDLDLLLSEE